ncbi:MAG: XRE family transcriptional regulator [Cyclobacteriaceae bacterium]
MIAQKIRAIRLRKKLTIQQLALKTNVTKGLLSKIENSRTVPSLPLFVKILESLDISFKDFFEDMSTDSKKGFWHMRKGQYVQAEHEGRLDFDFRRIVSPRLPSSTAEISLVRITPGGNISPSIIEGYEFQHVISGSFDCHINKEVIKMEEGDSIFMDASLPHFPVSTSKEEAVMLVVCFRFQH